MSNEKDKLKKTQGVKEDSPLKPDPETLHTTDPQEEMKGPVSSLMQGIKEKAEEKGGEHGDGEDEKE
jgi:hypothetical protein